MNILYNEIIYDDIKQYFINNKNNILYQFNFCMFENLKLNDKLYEAVLFFISRENNFLFIKSFLTLNLYLLYEDNSFNGYKIYGVKYKNILTENEFIV